MCRLFIITNIEIVINLVIIVMMIIERYSRLITDTILSFSVIYQRPPRARTHSHLIIIVIIMLITIIVVILQINMEAELK